VWWLSIPALAYLMIKVLTRSASQHVATVLVLVGAALLPWIVLPQGGPDPYIFYALLAVPFMCIAIAAVVVRLATVARNTLVTSVLLTAFAAFIFYAPLLYAQPIDRQEWNQRILFKSCRYVRHSSLAARLREAGLPITTGEIKGVEPGVIIPLRTRPTGWCWI
jgi:dolichyl-phosphate-mannose--protein O-mannosyl transferase